MTKGKLELYKCFQPGENEDWNEGRNEARNDDGKKGWNDLRHEMNYDQEMNPFRTE